MRANIWIRKEDEEKWNQIDNKSEFIHQALNREVIEDKIAFDMWKKFPMGEEEKKRIEDNFVPRPPDPDTGYPCCEKKRPCKHWHFNGDKGKWINELTGKEREPE